ncbi:MAG: Gfo/Idh/MocA family oxidoreductase [Melioribacteraceae bacterium]
MNDIFLVDRREFIKKISMIGGSAAALASMPWLKVLGESDTKSSSDKVRLALIGMGDRGKLLTQHIESFSSLINAELVAICDDYPPNLKAGIELTKGNAKTFTDYRKLLEEKNIDAVIIATPLHEHAHMTIESLNSGRHVFCEKAMARTMDDTKLMYDTHLTTGKILQIGHQRIFNPIYLDAIKKIHSGDIGQVTQIRAYWHRNNDWRRPVPSPELERKINWRHYEEYSAGLLSELASHQIQVANWIMKTSPVSVMGTGSINFWKDGREVDDNIAMIFSYPDGTQFIYDSVTSNKHYGCEEQIMGNKGTMELEINKLFSETPPQAPAILQLINDIEKDVFDTIPIGGASWVPETAVQYKGNYISENYKMDEVKLQLEAFVKFIRKGEAPEMLPIQGYNSSIWTLLSEQAIKKGEKLTLPDKYKV